MRESSENQNEGINRDLHVAHIMAEINAAPFFSLWKKNNLEIGFHFFNLFRLHFLILILNRTLTNNPPYPFSVFQIKGLD